MEANGLNAVAGFPLCLAGKERFGGDFGLVKMPLQQRGVEVSTLECLPQGQRLRHGDYTVTIIASHVRSVK